jgi:hypothetical protein
MICTYPLMSSYLRTRRSDLNPEQLRMALGYRHQTTPNTWLTGAALPPAQHLPALAEHLGVSPVELALVDAAERVPVWRDQMIGELERLGYWHPGREDAPGSGEPR